MGVSWRNVGERKKHGQPGRNSLGGEGKLLARRARGNGATFERRWFSSRKAE